MTNREFNKFDKICLLTATLDAYWTLALMVSFCIPSTLVCDTDIIFAFKDGSQVLYLFASAFH